MKILVTKQESMKKCLKNTLDQLRSVKQIPCVSVILPLLETKPQNFENFAHLRELVHKAIIKTTRKGYAQGQEVINKLEDRIAEQSEFLTGKGLGLFVSPEFDELIEFSFPVTEKVVVDTSFELRDLVFETNRMIEYLLVLVSSREVKMFSGIGKELTAVENEDFPFRYFEGHQLPPTPNRTGEGVEDSTLKKRWEMHFFEQAAHKIAKFKDGRNIPLILAGLPSNLGLFNKHHQLHHVILELKGNYQDLISSELSDVIWPEIDSYLMEQRERHLMELENASYVLTSMQDIWKAANEGNGRILLVEKDFRLPADIKDDLFTLHLDGGTQVYTKHIEDVVDDIIERILAVNGKVVFVENERLRNTAISRCCQGIHDYTNPSTYL